MASAKSLSALNVVLAPLLAERRAVVEQRQIVHRARQSSGESANALTSRMRSGRWSASEVRRSNVGAAGVSARIGAVVGAVKVLEHVELVDNDDVVAADAQLIVAQQ
jgi:hypothetical protein